MWETPFTKQVGIKYPIICGAMYPCSNPELVAAASDAGGIGIVQPLSMVFVHKHDYREGLHLIKGKTKNPIGVNILVEKSSQTYEKRMREYVKISLEEGVKFYITALGNPSWVIDMVRPHGGIVYHDVTTKKWADRAMKSGVDGLICVNNRAGGHAGTESPKDLFRDLSSYGVPLVCAGGIASSDGLKKALATGYAGIQMGTRFIATSECKVHRDYQDAIVKAKESDIVLTEKISGVPVSVIKTPYIERLGTKAGPIAKMMLKGRKTKHWMRLAYTLKSFWQLRAASQKGSSYKDYFQAGKSVEKIDRVMTVAQVIDDFVSS